MYLFMSVLALGIGADCLALDRQPNADYRARRMALAQKMSGGVAILFAGTEAEGPNAVYGFRQDNNFYYLSGWAEPGAALVIASAGGGQGECRPAALHGNTLPSRPQCCAGKMDRAEAGRRQSASAGDHRVRPGGQSGSHAR